MARTPFFASGHVASAFVLDQLLAPAPTLLRPEYPLSTTPSAPSAPSASVQDRYAAPAGCALAGVGRSQLRRVGGTAWLCDPRINQAAFHARTHQSDFDGTGEGGAPHRLVCVRVSARAWAGTGVGAGGAEGGGGRGGGEGGAPALAAAVVGPLVDVALGCRCACQWTSTLASTAWVSALGSALLRRAWIIRSMPPPGDTTAL